MTDRDDALEIAALRYRVIAEAAESRGGNITELIRDAASINYLDLRGERVQWTERTLWRYLKAYREGRIEALAPKPRSDRGSIRAIAREVLNRAIELRRESGSDEDPLRATDTIIDILVREKRIEPGSLARSTLDRFFRREGLARRQLRRQSKQVFKKILTESPFELVLVDFHHGPYVRIPPNDEVRRALLCAFIDHYSRAVPEGRYYLHEDFVALRYGFRRLLAAFGLPVKLYRDRGAAFQSTRFRVACERLEINLVASKAYAPEGRGCNERFNGTVKSQFESEVKRRDELLTLDELNAYFAAWLAERYHRDIHSETGEAPLDRFQRAASIRPAPALADVDEFLRIREKRSVHRKWSTVEVGGVRFLVSPALRKFKVHVLYDPSDLGHVLIEYDGRIVERAYPQKAGELPPQPSTLPSTTKKTDYLELLRADHEARNRAELMSLRLRAKDAAPELSLVDLLALLEQCRGKVLSPDERSEVSAFFRKMRPLEVEPARLALEAAQRRFGVALHIRVYLDALQTFLVRHRARGGLKK
jgi:putative transposase